MPRMTRSRPIRWCPRRGSARRRRGPLRGTPRRGRHRLRGAPWDRDPRAAARPRRMATTVTPVRRRTASSSIVRPTACAPVGSVHPVEGQAAEDVVDTLAHPEGAGRSGRRRRRRGSTPLQDRGPPERLRRLDGARRCRRAGVRRGRPCRRRRGPRAGHRRQVGERWTDRATSGSPGPPGVRERGAPTSWPGVSGSEDPSGRCAMLVPWAWRRMRAGATSWWRRQVRQER